MTNRIIIKIGVVEVENEGEEPYAKGDILDLLHDTSCLNAYTAPISTITDVPKGIEES